MANASYHLRAIQDIRDGSHSGTINEELQSMITHINAIGDIADDIVDDKYIDMCETCDMFINLCRRIWDNRGQDNTFDESPDSIILHEYLCEQFLISVDCEYPFTDEYDPHDDPTLLLTRPYAY